MLDRLLRLLRWGSLLLFLVCLVLAYAWMPARLSFVGEGVSRSMFFYVALGCFLLIELFMLFIGRLCKNLDKGQRIVLFFRDLTLSIMGSMDAAVASLNTALGCILLYLGLLAARSYDSLGLLAGVLNTLLVLMTLAYVGVLYLAIIGLIRSSKA